MCYIVTKLSEGQQKLVFHVRSDRMSPVSGLQLRRPIQETCGGLRVHGAWRGAERGIYLIPLHTTRVATSWRCYIHAVPPDTGKL
jgi:hypothetical protein